MLGVPSLYYFSISPNWLWQFLIPTVSNADFTHTHRHTHTGCKDRWKQLAGARMHRNTVTRIFPFPETTINK